MTTVIDERVVEMRFNNEDFEKNVRESMSTLDKLKDSLNFDSGKSLENLGKASKGFSLAGITETISEATTKFGALEIAGVTAIANITNKAVNLGTQLLKSLTIDQVTEGFEKYASKTQAVQTIMAATAKDFSNQTEQMKYVNDQMDKLMWFTDETSYNFLDMAGNIGKFTNNGVKLDQAVTAMQGIAQWAGISGANTQEASRAMYNFSQAMGAGAMKLQDWKSIEIANMATLEFKTVAAETAVEMGKLEKVSDGVYRTLQGHSFTLAQFSSYLKDSWFTSDVMVSSLSKYGEFTNQLYEVAQATDLTASELLKYIDQYKAGNIDLAAISKETNVSVQELDGYLKQLSEDTNDLGIRSFKASQEAKTFKEAIDSVKDAVSSQWMKTSEFIFGDYLQAKALWTGLANTMWEVFAAEGERRNQTLEKWKERNSLIEAFANVLNLVYRPLMAVRDAWHSMFPATAANRAKILDDLTVKFKKFTEAIQPTQKMLTGFKNTFAGVFSIAKITIQIITSIIQAIFPATRAFGSLLEMILTFTGTIGIIIQAISEYLDQIGFFTTLTETLGTVFGWLFDKIGKFASVIGGGLLTGVKLFVAVIVTIGEKVATFFSNFNKHTNILTTVVAKITQAFKFLKDAIMSIFTPIEKTTTVVKKATEYYGEAAGATAEFGTLTRDAADDVQTVVTPLGVVANALKIFGKVVAGIGAAVGLAFAGIIKVIGSFFNIFKEKMNATANESNILTRIFKVVFGSLREVFANIGNGIGKFFTTLKTDAGDTDTVFGRLVQNIKDFVTNADTGRIAAIALSIGLLAIVAASVKLAAKVEKATDSVTSVATTLTRTISGVGGSIKGTFDSIKRAVDQFSKRNLILETIMTFAKAFTMVALSLTVLSLVPTDKLLVVSGIMLGFITIFSILTAVVIGLSKKLNQAKFQVSFRAMAKSIILLAAAMGILAASVSILAGVKIEGSIKDLYAKIGAVLVLLAGVVGASIALSKFSKTLPKGAVLLLAMAIAMRQLALAVKEFAYMPVDNINDHWGTYIAIFTGLSLVLAAAGHVKVTSAVALLALASAMKVILPAMGQIVEIAKELPYDKIAQAASDNIGAIVLFFAGLISALAFLIALIESSKNKVKKLKKGGTNLFGGIGGAFAGIGLGMVLIVSSIKKLHELYSEFSEGELADIGKMLTRIVALVGIFTLVITVVNNLTSKNVQGSTGKQFTRIAILMVGLAAAVRIMVSAVKALSSLSDMGNAWQAVVMVSILGAVLAAVVGVAGTVQKAIPAMVALISATVAIGILIGELAILSLIVDNPGINKALAILAGMFVALNVTMRSLEKIKDVKAGPILGVLGIIAVMCASLIALSKMNFIKVGTAALSMSIVMLAVGSLFKTINKLDVDSKAMLKKIGLLLLTTLALAPIAAALFVLAKVVDNGNWAGVLASAAGMSLALIAVAGVLAVLSKIGSSVGQLAAAASVILISAALIEIAYALKIMEDMDLGESAAKVAALLGIVSGIMLVFGLISMIPGLGEVFIVAMLAFAASMAIIAGAFTIFAYALEPLSNGLNLLTPALASFLTLDFATMTIAGEALLILSVGLGALGLAGLAVGLGSLGILALAGALYVLGLAAPTAAQGLQQLQAVDLVGIAFGLAALGLAGAGIGLLSPLLLAAAVGISAFAAALLLLNVSIQASASMFQGFVIVLNNTVTAIKEKVTEIKDAFKQLLPDIAAALKDGPGGNTIMGAVKSLGEKIAGKKGSGEGLVGTISQLLGWSSPPQFILDLLSDIGTAFGMDSSATSAAGASGSRIGDIFGSNMATKISGWLSNIGSGVNSFFASLGSGSKVISSMGSDLDSTGAQAEKFGKTTQKTGNIITDGIDYVKEKLEEGKDYVTDLVDASDLLPEEFKDIMDGANGASDAVEGFGDAAEGAAGKAGKASKSLKEFADSLKETLAGQLNFFEKLELKTETTSEQLLENMRSNIDGFASWSHRMTVLAERFNQHGIDISLYEELADMGVQGYDTMNAIYNMTDEQLDQLRDLWQTKMTLPEGQADIVASGYKYMGEMATKGFSDALNEHKAAHEAAHGLGQAALDGLSEVLEVNSPSKATERIGRYLIEGLRDGIDSVYGQGILYFAVKHVTEYILELFNENLSPETIGEVGSELINNLFAAFFGEGDPESNPLIASFVAAFEDLSIVEENITLFVQTIIDFLNQMFEMEDSESQSMLFYRYGLALLTSYSNAMLENLIIIQMAIMTLCGQIRYYLDMQDLPGKFYSVGQAAGQGLVDGLLSMMDAVAEAAAALAQAAADAVSSALEVNSPSKVFIRIAHSVGEGFVMGINDSARPVYNAARDLAEAGIDGASYGMGRLQDVLNEGMDLNPVITPMLDLSLIRSQMDELNALMSSPEYDALGQNGGDLSGTKNPSQVSFVQNNYSPKALSRYEIYRQTKNQISQLKGAIG